MPITRFVGKDDQGAFWVRREFASGCPIEHQSCDPHLGSSTDRPCGNEWPPETPGSNWLLFIRMVHVYMKTTSRPWGNHENRWHVIKLSCSTHATNNSTVISLSITILKSSPSAMPGCQRGFEGEVAKTLPKPAADHPERSGCCIYPEASLDLKLLPASFIKS